MQIQYVDCFFAVVLLNLFYIKIFFLNIVLFGNFVYIYIVQSHIITILSFLISDLDFLSIVIVLKKLFFKYCLKFIISYIVFNLIFFLSKT